MPVPNYTAKELSVLSTVIARGARLRSWDSALGVDGAALPVEEVQCMHMNGGLYIAGNHIECESIRDFFRAFGATDHASFIKCLRYTYGLITYPYARRAGDLGRGYEATFSGQDNRTFTFAGALVAQLMTPLTAAEIQEINTAVTRTTLPPVPDRPLTWFLRKFVGAAAIAGLGRPALGALNYATDYNGQRELTIVNDRGGAHAELKLIRFMTSAVTSNTAFLGNQTVTVGGLKRACSFCNSWLGYYIAWVRIQYRIAVVLPDESCGIRAEGGGAGDRPTGAGEGSFGRYVQLLFNGLANNNCLDIAARVNDDAW